MEPETALELIQTLHCWTALILGGSVLLGVSAYIVLLCLEKFSPQPSSKARLAELPHPVGWAPVAEENLDLFAAETPILAAAERLGEETVPARVVAHDAQHRVTLLLATLESEPTGPWGFLNFLRFRRAAVTQKRGSSLIVDAQLEKLAQRRVSPEPKWECWAKGENP